MSDLRWLFDWFVEGVAQALRFFVVLTVGSIVGGIAVAAWQFISTSKAERRWRREIDNDLEDWINDDRTEN
jgi:hypothetical protein